MAIETTFEALQRQLEQLKAEFSELRVNAEDFYPASGACQSQNGHKSDEPPPPVVSLADKAADLEGEAQEGLLAANKGAQAVRHPRNLVEALMALGTVQRSLNKILRQYLVEVAAYDALQTLVQMGRELGDGWPRWSELIKAVINDCRDHLVQAFQALAACWLELADKSAANSVSVQATNIGQQITMRENMNPTVEEVT